MREQAKHFIITKEEFEVFDCYFQPRAKYVFILGAPATGKTTLAKDLESIFGFQLIDYEKVSNMLKEKLGG